MDTMEKLNFKDEIMAEIPKLPPQREDFQSELDHLRRDYHLKNIRLQIENRSLELIKVANMDELLDRITHEDELPFWAEIWPAAIGLAIFILQNQEAFAGKRVLELGSGTGLSGIAAKIAGARVTQSDFIEAAIPFIRVNCLRNQVAFDDFLLADWRKFPDIPAEYDFIIGADILYEKTVHSDLANVFGKVLKPGGNVILSDPGRGYGQQFVIGLTEQGWQNSPVRIPVCYEEQNFTIDINRLSPPGNRKESVSL